MSRLPSHLTGGIVWKSISGHHHIALIADHNNRKSWKLPVVKQDQYVQSASDPFEEISLITGVEVKDPVSADTVFYPDNDPPSYAIFWHLRVKANTREFTPSGNLNEWRKAAVHRLLGEFEQPGRQVSASTLYIAAEIRDEHFHNIYYKNRLTKTVINTLLLLLTVTVSCIFIYMAYITYVFPVPLISFPNGTRLLQTMPVLTGAMLFGLFGGVMSSLFRVKKTSDSLKNPELFSTYFFTTIRVFTGGAAAIAIFFFLESECFNLVLPTLDLLPASGTTYFVISFLCGFFERLLMRAVSSISDKE